MKRIVFIVYDDNTCECYQVTQNIYTLINFLKIKNDNEQGY